jgi:aspartate beta-hydroxylase/beta-hydroxylase
MNKSISKDFSLRAIFNKKIIDSKKITSLPINRNYKNIFNDKAIIDNFEDIKLEIINIVNSNKAIKYKDIDSIRASEVAENWSLYYPIFLRKKNIEATQSCPTLMNTLSSYKNIINVAIASLDPNTPIKPHKGPFAGMLRYHLGIEIPTTNPPYIIVNKESYTWKEKEGIVIDDYYEHEVINNCNERRIILIIDFFKPMPLTLSLINKFLFWMDKIKWANKFLNKINKKR